jgi:hypothetical protein
MSRRHSWSLVLALAGTALVAACSHRDGKTMRTAGADRDLTLASHGSVSPDLAIAPDEIFGTRKGRATSTVRHRMLIHEASGRDLAATENPAIEAPAAAAIVAVAPTPAPAMTAEPRPGHVAVVGALSGDAASRPDPTADPSGTGPYSGDLGGGIGHDGWGGPVIRGGGVGDDDHCERRPPRGIMGGGGGMMGPRFFTPAMR